jgi:aminopeptidase N
VESPMIEAHDRSPNGLMSGWNAYGKPGVMLHFLRNEVVDSAAFDTAFREYVRRWAFHHPTPADFFRSMNDGLGEDLSWFWRGWVLTTAHLDQSVDSVKTITRRGTAANVLFLSNKRDMVAPVEVRVTMADGSVQTLKLPVETWFRSSTTAVPLLMLPAGARVIRAEIDPRGVYPDVDRSNNVWTGQ